MFQLEDEKTPSNKADLIEFTTSRSSPVSKGVEEKNLVRGTRAQGHRTPVECQIKGSYCTKYFIGMNLHSVSTDNFSWVILNGFQ